MVYVNILVIITSGILFSVVAKLFKGNFFGGLIAGFVVEIAGYVVEILLSSYLIGMITGIVLGVILMKYLGGLSFLKSLIAVPVIGVIGIFLDPLFVMVFEQVGIPIVIQI